jgi:hypothetical protein
MADIIVPSHPTQAETYPKEEWLWRGIIDPSLTLPEPSWWEIDTLDPADILDAWDFGWKRHRDPDGQKTGFINNRVWRTRSGNPSQRLGDGVYFGGGGSWDLPKYNLDWNEVSVIIEFHTIYENNTSLDAFFSHYRTDGSQFTLQNDWSNDKMRWSCGQPGSDTVEVDGTMTGGIVGVSGVHLYKRGELVGSVPESGEAFQELNFVLGAIQTDNNPNTQYMRGTIRKILIVKRRLTDEEQMRIFTKIKECEGDEGELLINPSFKCGLTGWTHNPSYPATLTDNGDGSIHLKSESQYGSVVPVFDEFPNATYTIRIKVSNVSGNGKISYRRGNNQWVTVVTYTEDGTYEATFTDDIIEINVGANNDDTFEADYEYISLKQTGPTVQFEPLTTENGEVLTTENGEELTI